jgi:type I restriction enzyme, S subunit
MENKLPEGWEYKPLKDVCFAVKDKGNVGDCPYLEIGNIDLNSKRYVFTDKQAVKGCKQAQQKDVLISRVRPTRGAIVSIKENALAVSSAFTILRSRKEEISDRYLLRSLSGNQNFLNYMGNNCTGTMYPTVSEKVILDYLIPVAPVDKQERIADKLDSLLAKVKDTQSRLDKIPLILKRLRQAIVEGTFSNIDEEKLVALGDALPKRGIFDGPFGSDLKTVDYASSGVRVIRLENIGRLKFIEEKESYVSNEKYKTLLKHTVYKGDVIFASFIADEIRVCVLPKLKTHAIAKADCFCIRPDKNMDSEFLAFQLTCKRVYDSLVGEVHGVTRPRINTTQLKKLMVYVLPVEEQTAIVQKIKSSLNKIDHIEEYFATVKAYTDKLEQSILAKAFCGELVKQAK